MRLAKFSRTLLLLALPAVLVTCAAAQERPNVQPSNVRDQLKQGSAAPQPQPAAPQPAPARTQATPPVKAPAKANPPAKAAGPAAATKAAAPVKAPAKAAAQKAAKTPVEKPAEGTVSATRRDPFDALLNKSSTGNAAPENLPPGKAGLMVGTLRINGIVRGSGGMIAIVSNPQQRVYFLREGDKLYDGSVEHITLEAVSFHEFGKDAFGKPLERQVTRRLYPSPGEQQ
jgi:Tfp pilus assembly protein PilP